MKKWMGLLLVFPALLFANVKETSSLNVQGAYYFGNQEGLGINGDGSLAPISYEVVSNGIGYRTNQDPGRKIGTTWGGVEAKIVYHHRWTIPVLTGEGALFKDNHVTFEISPELSPVHFTLSGSILFSPIALLDLFGGTALESGWNFFGLFNGLGRNLPGVSYTAPLSEPFSGLVSKTWAGGTLKFDFGAVIPGDWSHVVLAISPKVEYLALFAPNVDKDTAWQKEADAGMNFNGWKYYGTYFVGYQLPEVPVLNTIGLLVESEQYIDSYNVNRSPMTNGWGSDFVKWSWAPLVQLELSEKDSLTILFQWSREIDYSDDTIGNRYFEYRVAEGTYTKFNRIAFSYGRKF